MTLSEALNNNELKRATSLGLDTMKIENYLGYKLPKFELNTVNKSLVCIKNCTFAD